MTFAALTLISLAFSCTALPAWDFNSSDDLQIWAPNSSIDHPNVQDGVVRGKTTGWDPFFTCRSVEFLATPWQFAVIRLKANQSGEGELFWSKDLEGQYGGLSQDKSTRFKVTGDNTWHDYAVFPFWHAEGTIRQLRLDLFDDLEFELDSVRIEEWGAGQPPLSEVYTWTFHGDTTAWHVFRGASDLFAPPLDLPIGGRGWVTVQLQSDKDAEGAVLWAAPNVPGLHTEPFSIRGDSKMRAYNIEVASYPSWNERLAAFGMRLPDTPGLRLESVAISEAPSGPPEIIVKYLGFENGVNRAKRPCRVLAQFENAGGSLGTLTGLALKLPEGLELISGPEPATIMLDYTEVSQTAWEVLANEPKEYLISLEVSGEGAPPSQNAVLSFLPARDVVKADYVPAPQPVKTGFDICMYYFPGWDADVKWDCIRGAAPIRKPLLGYYDEGNPECVDWQIKGALENGINCVLVDWYWIAGNQPLTHWFEAYRKARYRDQLQVAIMWANHNPPKTHSREDWRNVTREWIDRYFNLPAYYRLHGKPALFLWNPEGLRSDLGGSAEAKAALDESQAMAVAAGYDGIEFVAVNNNQSPALVKMLHEEGYAGITNYHEWGRALDLSQTHNRARYDDLVETVPETWIKRDGISQPLTYYPVVDTGWDSRPWHGNKSLVITGRNVAGFETLLRAAKAFSEQHSNRMIVFGPANEWGEGSYIEPNAEFGFEMYEAVRRVFAQGDPASWPVNLSPADVGRGPYDFPVLPPATSWNFDDDPGAWTGMMGVSPLACENGALVFKTTSADPAIMTPLRGILARKHPKAVVKMQCTGPLKPGDRAQLFWSVGGSATSEAASLSLPLATDGAMHEYIFNLASNPRWRGRISTFRFDPCGSRDVEVRVDGFYLQAQ